jgi:UDP-N-acetylmuramyl tripeptide synthase
LPLGSVLVSATNGKTTTAAMAAEILRPRLRVAHNASGANLVSGVASTLLAARGAELGLFEVDEGALPEVARRVRPRAVVLGNLFRDQLDRYGELEHIAERWRAAVSLLGPETTLVVNADDPLVASLADDHEGVIRFGVDDPSRARAALPHAADSKYCVRCGHPYRYDAVYVGHLGAYRCEACGHMRPPLDVAAREIVPDGLDGVSFTLATSSGNARARLTVPGLYNVYNALFAASLCLALGVHLDEVVAGLERFSAAFGRFERFVVGGRTVLLLLIKNPAGANEVLRTLEEGGVERTLVVALNDRIADGRDVSWIWDVDFEPLLERVERIVATGERAAELGLRFAYGGLPHDRLELVPDLQAALDRGLALTPPGGELVVLPTYTAMLGLRAVATDRGLTRPYWESAR